MLATVPRKGQLSDVFLRLKQLRQDHNLTQLQLFRATGIAEGTIKAWESGRVQDLTLDAVRRLAPAYGMTPEALTRYLNGQPEPPSTAAKQSEPYDLGTQSVPITMVRVAEVTIAAGLESWRTLVHYPVSSDIVGNRRNVVLVRVTGDCMEPAIQAGDMALIDRENLSPTDRRHGGGAARGRPAGDEAVRHLERGRQADFDR
jgi:repressor LexA